jgi:hypothetical protein
LNIPPTLAIPELILPAIPVDIFLNILIIFFVNPRTLEPKLLKKDE